MALHKKNYNVQDETWQTNEQLYDKHLARMINADLANSGRVVARVPEMKGGTTIAFLPYPEFPSDGSKPTRVYPDRWDADPEKPRSYNNWLFIASDKGVVRFGKQWISVLFDNPDDSGWDYDNDHPIQLIARHTGFAVKKRINVETPYGSSSSDDWNVLVNGDESRKEFGVIKYPEVMCLGFAVVYHSGKNNYYNETGAPYGASSNDPLVVFVMSRSVSATLMDEIDKPLVNNDPSKGLLHPNVTGCRFVHFYDKQLGACPMLRAAAASTGSDGDGFGGRRGPRDRIGEKPSTGFGYNVVVTETIDGAPGSKDVKRDAVAKYALGRVQPWEKVLRGHGPDECADLVQSMAGLPLSVLSHAWQSHPEFFNETTKALMARRVTSLPDKTTTVGANPRRSEIEDFDFNAPAQQTPTIPFVNPVPAPSGPIDASTENDVYSKDRLLASQARLRAEINNQMSAGTQGPQIPDPPQFRNKPQ